MRSCLRRFVAAPCTSGRAIGKDRLIRIPRSAPRKRFAPCAPWPRRLRIQRICLQRQIGCRDEALKGSEGESRAQVWVRGAFVGFMNEVPLRARSGALPR